MNTITSIFIISFTIGAGVTLLGSAYLAGRWTRQPWLPALAAAIGLIPFAFGIAHRFIVNSLNTQRWPLGAATVGGVLAMLHAVEWLAIAATIGALVLLSARRARHRAN